MRVRAVLRVLSPLLALALAAVGVLVALEAATAWVAPRSSPLVVPWPAWRSALDPITWSSTAVRGIAIAVGVVGLVVLLVGLRSRRHDLLLNDPVPEVTVTTSPRSLARAVGHEVRAHADVLSASVVASGRRITVHAATDPAGDVAEVREAVRARIDEVLERLPLARRPRVAVQVSTAQRPGGG